MPGGEAAGLGFGRVVYDPFSAAGRFGPAFMPGARGGGLGFWQGRSRPFFGRRPIRPGIHAGCERRRAWVLAGSFTTLFRPQADSARHSCRVREAAGLGFGRVVYDPFSAAGRFGPAFMPGARGGGLGFWQGRLRPFWPQADSARIHAGCRGGGLGFWQGRLRPVFGRRPIRPGIHAGCERRRAWVLAGSFTTLFRPQADSARHSCRVREAAGLGFGRVVYDPFRPQADSARHSCRVREAAGLGFGRVVYDPFSAAGRFGPAFMPGARGGGLGFWQGRLRPVFGRRPIRPGIHAGCERRRAWVLAGSFTTRFRPQADSARHLCRVPPSRSQFFGRVDNALSHRHVVETETTRSWPRRPKARLTSGYGRSLASPVADGHYGVARIRSSSSRMT